MRAFNSEDFPTLERPKKATSGELPKSMEWNFGADQRNFEGLRSKYEEACFNWEGVGEVVSQQYPRA